MARHWHPVLRMYISPLTTSRTFTVRLLPPCFAGPMSGSTWLHSSAPVLVIDPLQPSGGGRNGLAHLANQLNGALVEADHRARRIGRLGVEIKHILHAGHVLAIDLRHAPHLLAPRLELVLGQAPAHGLAREAVVIGEANHLAGEQLDGPAGSAFGRAGACGRDQKRFLMAGKLAGSSGTGLLGQGLVEIASTKRRLV